MSDPAIADRQGHEHREHTARAACPETSAQARGIAQDFLESMSPPATPETIDTVLLVVSELVTNAYQHAGGLRGMRLSGGPGTVHIEVADGSPALPHHRVTDLMTGDETGGFGWPLVHHLAQQVTVDRRTPRGGKTVHVTVA